MKMIYRTHIDSYYKIDYYNRNRLTSIKSQNMINYSINSNSKYVCIEQLEVQEQPKQSAKQIY